MFKLFGLSPHDKLRGVKFLNQTIKIWFFTSCQTDFFNDSSFLFTCSSVTHENIAPNTTYNLGYVSKLAFSISSTPTNSDDKVILNFNPKYKIDDQINKQKETEQKVHPTN